jgi:hypothetical protein
MSRLGRGCLLLFAAALFFAGVVGTSIASVTSVPPAVAKRLAAEARRTARSLGDASVKTAHVYGPDSRYLLVKASSGDLVEKTANESGGFYLIVLQGHFICDNCSVPPGGTPPRGTLATIVWSRRWGVTDLGVTNHLGRGMSHLGKPVVLSLERAP